MELLSGLSGPEVASEAQMRLLELSKSNLEAALLDVHCWSDTQYDRGDFVSPDLQHYRMLGERLAMHFWSRLGALASSAVHEETLSRQETEFAARKGDPLRPLHGDPTGSRIACDVPRRQKRLC